jgi:hypothetical protein
VEFSGFKKNTEIYFVSKNPYNVEISMCQDDFKSLYYEMKIPFKSIYSNYSNISHNTLSIGLETGELKLAASENKPVGINNNTRGEHPRGSSAGGGKRSGGNSKGQGYSGGTPNSSKTALSSPTKIWIKNILLATP